MSLSKIFPADSRFIPKKILPEVEITTGPMILSPAPPEVLVAETEQAETIVPIPPDSEKKNDHEADQDLENGSEMPDIEAIRNEAYRLGTEEGKKQALLEFSSAIQAFTDCCSAVDGLRAEILEESREEMINLIVAVAEKIILEELKTGRNTIAQVLEESLQAAIPSKEFHVILNPEDLRLAAQHKPRLLATIRGLHSLVLKTDPRITIGGCRLESDICEVDATVETRLATVEKHLREQAGTTSDMDEEPSAASRP